MSETRRLSTRNRGEPPLKLRKTSPDNESFSATPRTLAHKSSIRSSAADATPLKTPKTTSKVKAKDSPKPSTPAPEPEMQPEVKESIATLMEKSRQRWVKEGGIFQRFWTKPPRKKKGEPAPDMPTKAQMNMVELGLARMIIEPHVFDVTLYGVKKPALTWQPPIEAPHLGSMGSTPNGTARPTPQNPYARPVQAPSSLQPAAGPGQNQRGLAPNPYAMPATQTSVPSASPAPGSSVTPQLPPAPQAAPQAQQITPTPAPAPGTPINRPPQPSAQPAPQQTPAVPHPDPVIQMLAQRAANDPSLKELMKIVAAGSESPERLKEFQRHINEITEIVKARQEAANAAPDTPTPQAQQQPWLGGLQQQSQASYRPPTYIQSKPATAPPNRYDFTALAFDFVRGNDCYLIPHRSIIEHQATRHTTLISFLVTRKGSDVIGSNEGKVSKSIKPDVEYYQPVTVQLLTPDQKIRDILNQTVANKEAVAKEMTEVIEKLTRAPEVATVIQKGNSDGVTETSEESGKDRAGELEIHGDDDDVIKAEWEAPNSLLPL